MTVRDTPDQFDRKNSVIPTAWSTAARSWVSIASVSHHSAPRRRVHAAWQQPKQIGLTVNRTLYYSPGYELLDRLGRRPEQVVAVTARQQPMQFPLYPEIFALILIRPNARNDRCYR